MKIAVFGGTGFIGQYVVSLSLEAGYSVKSLSRVKQDFHDSVEWIEGTVSDRTVIEKVMESCHAVVYCIGILREIPGKSLTFHQAHVQGIKDCVSVATSMKIPRFILISANGIDSKKTEYQRTKIEGEKHLKSSELDWTIVRPSMVFGDPQGKMEIGTQLHRQIVKPWIPAPMFFIGLAILDAGKMRFQPVHVEELVTTVIHQIFKSEWHKKTMVIGGDQVLTWKELIMVVAESVGRNKWIIPVPIWAITWGIKLL